MLIKSGNLRRSIQLKEKTGTSLTITADTTLVGSDLDYAQLHNESGEIVVTEKMKAFFWAKCYEAENKQSTNQRGERRNTKQNKQLSQDALFWQNLALKKVGDKTLSHKGSLLAKTKSLEFCLKTNLTTS